MLNRQLVAATHLAVLTFAVSVPADEVRFTEENGITYRENVRTVEQPVVTVQTQEQEETVYRWDVKTEPKEIDCNVLVPLTTYDYRPQVYGWWNPFQPNYVVHRWLPRTTWQWSTQKIQVPVTSSQWVPETRTVQRPVRTLRIDRTNQVERTAIGRSPTRQAATTGPANRFAENPPFGGISRLDSDPPRYSTRPSNQRGTFLR